MAKKPRSVPFEQIAQQVAGAPSVSAPFDLRAPGGRGYRLLENNVSLSGSVTSAVTAFRWDGTPAAAAGTVATAGTALSR